MTEPRADAAGGQVTAPTERTSGQVWRLGAWVILVQIVTLILLWVMQAVFAGG
jgi:hypothetical protein